MTLQPVAPLAGERTDRDRDIWLHENKVHMERVYAQALGHGHDREAAIFKHATEQLVVHDNSVPYEMLGYMNKVPVTIDEFVESNEFLGSLMEVWPALKDDLRAMNPDVFAGEEPKHEVLMGGATGTGKTHLSQITTMFGTYRFTCFDTPQRLYNLTVKTPIVFMLQSVSPTITKRVIYKPLRELFLAMPYTAANVAHDKYTESELLLEDNIVITPAAASLQSIVGQAIPGGILDEVNFMRIIDESKQVAGPQGLGGHYDQAEQVYTNVSRRRKRSFLTTGYSIGTLCVVSSTRYVNDFLDRRIDEVRELDEPNILTMRRKQYEVTPKSRYPSGKTFTLLVGTEEYPSRVLEASDVAGVTYPENAHLEEVPIELINDFRKDPEGAQRDYVGIASASITPFFRKRQKITDAQYRGMERELPALVEDDYVDLAQDGLPTLIPENIDNQSTGWKRRQRFIHVDLSRVKDRCGIGMVSLDGFVAQPMDDGKGGTITVPKYTVEMACVIQPSAMSEIDIADVRNWIMRLITVHRLNVHSVTFDGFDSRETIQALTKAGIRSGVISVDRGTEAYDNLRDAFYEDRVDVQEDCEHFLSEVRTLEYIAKKNKVDHPPKGYKDAADAVCGAMFVASQSRKVRSETEMAEDRDGDHAPTRATPEHRTRRRSRRRARR